MMVTKKSEIYYVAISVLSRNLNQRMGRPYRDLFAAKNPECPFREEWTSVV